MRIRIVLLCAAVVGLGTSNASAQVRTWINAGTGDWFVAANWSPSPPAAGEHAFINNGGTAQIISGSTPSLTQVMLASAAATSGQLDLIDGQISATSLIFIGNHGTGYMRINGTTSVVTTPLVGLGLNSAVANGTLEFNDGTINAGFNVGHAGTGLVIQNAGVVNSSTNILMGNSASGNGTWEMHGGEVNVLSGALYVGSSSGMAVFEQYAGTEVNLGGLVVGVNGTYELHGGEFTANQVSRSSSGSPIFTMDAGRLDVGTFGLHSVPFSLTVGGGIVGPSGPSLPNQMILYGDYTQNAAGTFEVKAVASTVCDRILMIGQPTLNNGILDFALAYTPSIGHQYMILKNDAVFPVVGTFAGLPEGAKNWVGAHLLQVTYAGGDGNDIVLTVVEPTCVEPPPDMTAWWPLDELVGPVSEDLVNDNDGATTGSPTPTIGEYAQNSYCFSGGSAQYVEVPHAPEIDFGTTDFSIDAWVKTTTTTGVRVIVEKRISTGGVTGYSMYLASGTLGFQLADGSGSTSCSCSPTASCTNYSAGGGGFVADGQWHHVAVTVDRIAGGGTFYVDGALVATFDPMCRPDPYANTGPLRIGYVSLVSGSNFEGCIDEVELFSRALTAPEVASLYVAKELGKCKCDCPADVYGDEFIDGLDVAAFTRCILLSSMAGDHCSCADMNTDEAVDLVDIPLFTDELLGGGPCP